MFKLWQSFVDQVKADVRRSIVAVFISSEPSLLPVDVVDAADVKRLILSHVFDA